ncbi:uncharacterized protein LOC117122589 isoform X2 [Anneissia japonica]|uniref:uncharacterized protein LOC117122589 isoform X2 n=1 Tax=Anneissia japonica TaxID=1529436 RepID=UPI0014254F6E|nr:uncharacterized protein LOC117122589 isoform X2 [Anneissia japonica]
MYQDKRNFSLPPYPTKKMKLSFRQTFTLFTGAVMTISGMLLVLIGMQLLNYLTTSTIDHGISPIVCYTGLMVFAVGVGNVLSGIQMSGKRSQRSTAWIAMVANLIIIIIIGTTIALVTYDVYDYLNNTADEWQYVDQVYSVLMVIYCSLLILSIIAVFTECCIALDPLGGNPYPQPGYGHGYPPGPYKY